MKKHKRDFIFVHSSFETSKNSIIDIDQAWMHYF